MRKEYDDTSINVFKKVKSSVMKKYGIGKSDYASNLTSTVSLADADDNFIIINLDNRFSLFINDVTEFESVQKISRGSLKLEI